MHKENIMLKLKENKSTRNRTFIIQAHLSFTPEVLIGRSKLGKAVAS